ncbi:MAG: WD40 repeat domain-containing protein, partial [Verrucomicrobiales bacterium]|nr:WD40 repeat domain-containing protein [Verrucomicrobiales bacterium]
SALPKSLLRTRTQQRDLNAIVLKALAWESSERYASADALAEDVQRHLNDMPVLASQHSWRYVLGKFSRRHLPLVAGLGVAVVAVIAGLTTSTILFFREQKARLAAVAASAEVEQRERETLRVLSRSDFATAQRMKAEGDHQGAVALLTRALRNDPEFGVAGADLQMMLTQADFPQPLTPPLPLADGWDVTDGAVSADGGAILAAASADDGRYLILCRLDDNQWKTHELEVNGATSLLTVNGSGKLYCFVEAGKDLKIGEVTGDEPKWQCSNDSQILSVAMAAKEPRLAFGCADGSVWLWDQQTGKSARKLGSLGSEVSHIKIIGNDRKIIAACADGTLHRLNDSGTEENVLMKMPGRVTVVSTPVKTGIIAVGDEDGNVACCREDGTELMKPTPLHEGRVMALMVASSVGTILSAGGDLRLRWVEMETGKDLEAPVESGGFVAQILISRAGDEAMVVGADSSLRIWRREGRGTITVRKPQHSRFVAMSAAGKAVALKREQGRMIEVLGLASHAALGVQLHVGGLLENPAAIPRSVGFLHNPTVLACSLDDGAAATWDTAAAKIRRLAQWTAPAYCIGRGFGETILTAFADGSLLESEATSKPPVLLAKADQTNDRWDDAVLSADGRAAVWAKFTPTKPEQTPPAIRVWTRTHGARDVRGEERLSAVAIHASGPTLACGLGSGYLRLVNVGQADDGLIKPLHQGRITDVAFSPDGKMLLSASSDGTASLWDVAQLTPLSDYMRFGEPVLRVAFSGDGKRFACATAREIVVGNVSTHSLLGLPFNLPLENNLLALNADGTRVAFGLRGGIVAVYDVAPQLRHPPSWFLDTANALASRTFNSSNVLEATEHPGLEALRQTMPSPLGDDPWSRVCAWLFAAPPNRPLSPWSDLTPDEYLKAITSRPGTDANP